jgi:hypothetical protein
MSKCVKNLVMTPDRRMTNIQDEITVSHASVQNILKGSPSWQRVRDICARNEEVPDGKLLNIWPTNARSRPPIEDC